MLRKKRLAELDDACLTDGDPAVLSRTFRMELLTPMVGGGAEPWWLDPQAPVRLQGIKGQLRFWWRTMQSEPDPGKLLNAESRLFGGTVRGKDGEQHLRSRVVLSLTYPEPPEVIESDPVSDFSSDPDLPPYLLFAVDLPGGATRFNCCKGLAFDLHVTAPAESWATVENVLRLWCLFGGVGARTRRGLGQLHCDALLKAIRTPADVGAFVRSVTPACPVPTGHPVLQEHGLYLSSPQSSSSTGAWKSLVERYRGFRQKRSAPGRTDSPGVSRWPEPNAFRRLFGEHSSKPCKDPGSTEVWFPRVAYGLPIQVKFKDEFGGSRFEIKPRGRDWKRWPSPCWLGVVRLADSGVAQSMLVLRARLPDPEIALQDDRANLGRSRLIPYAIGEDEGPFASEPKAVPDGCPIQSGQDPYEALARGLRLQPVGRE